jgi:hypothetical protein
MKLIALRLCFVGSDRNDVRKWDVFEINWAGQIVVHDAVNDYDDDYIIIIIVIIIIIIIIIILLIEWMELKYHEKSMQKFYYTLFWRLA